MCFNSFCLTSTPVLKQTWVACSVLILSLAQGMVFGYSSVLLPALQKPESDIHIDIHKASHLVSCIGLSCIIGLIVSSSLMDWFGRKRTYLLMIIPGSVGWLLIYFAQSFEVLLLGRVFCGITVGTVMLVSFILGEYISPKYRGMFLSLKTASTYIGIAIIHNLGYYFDWKLLAVLTFMCYVIAYLMACTWPESPVWFASRKQLKNCEESFLWLRGTDEKSIEELQELIIIQKEHWQNGEFLNGTRNVMTYLKTMKRKDFLQPIGIIVIAFILLESSGGHYFPAYALQFIGEITEDTPQSFHYTLFIDLAIAASATFSSVLVRVLERRTLLLSTGLAAVVTLFITSIYLFLTFNGILSNRPTIGISLLFLYFTLANLGCTTIPLVLLGEVFPAVHRAAGSIVAGLLMYVLLWAAMTVTPYLLIGTKMYGTFAIFGLIITIALLILYFILPETKDKTLEEIEYYLNNGCFREEEVVKDDVITKMI